MLPRPPVFLALALLPACLTPPAVMPARAVNLEQALKELPPDGRLIERELADGKVLRGVYVPSDEGAPLVLHLQESTGSFATTQWGCGPLFRRLSDLGFASLMMDYSGVGPSDGERSVDNLESDAWAMWEAAVELAGGDPERVIVRGVSLGTVAVALLHRAGARPAAWELLLPVRAETITVRWAREFRGPFAAGVAKLVFRPVADVDLVEQIERMEAPLLVVGSEGDPFLSPDERSDVIEAVRRSGGTWRDRQGGHMILSAETKFLLSQEVPFLRTLFPDVPDARARAQALVDELPPELRQRLEKRPEERARLDLSARHLRHGKAEVKLAAALGNEDPLDAAWMFWLFGDDDQYQLPIDPQRDVLSLDDQPEPVPVDLVVESARMVELAETFVNYDHVPEPETLVQFGIDVRNGKEIEDFSVSIDFTPGPTEEFTVDTAAFYTELRARGLSEPDAVRQLLRILLFGLHTPHRLRATDTGPVLEMHDGSGWIEVDWRRAAFDS